MPRVAVLDDYQGVALQMADWSVLAPDCRVQVFRDHLTDLDALADRLRDFEVVICMRERTPFRRDLLERLPNLRLLVTTGNTLLMPHAGYVTEEQYRVRYRDTVEDIAAYLRGAPLRVLNPKARETSRPRPPQRENVV